MNYLTTLVTTRTTESESSDHEETITDLTMAITRPHKRQVKAVALQCHLSHSSCHIQTFAYETNAQGTTEATMKHSQ